MKFVVAIILPILLTGLTGCLRSLVFPATHLSQKVLDRISDEWKWEQHFLNPTPNVRLVGLEKPPVNQNSPWVFFMGGNGMSIGANVYILDKSKGDADRGMAVYAYRGYDGSQGEPSEEALVSDAVKIAKDLIKRRRILLSKFYIAGHSLGSGVAAQLALKLLGEGIEPAGLILVSAFVSLRDAATEMIPMIPGGWLLEDRFDTRSALPQIASSATAITIIHGRKDIAISVEHGRLLAKDLGSRATYIELEKAGHNDIFLDPEMPKILEKLIQ